MSSSSSLGSVASNESPPFKTVPEAEFSAIVLSASVFWFPSVFIVLVSERRRSCSLCPPPPAFDRFGLPCHLFRQRPTWASVYIAASRHVIESTASSLVGVYVSDVASSMFSVGVHCISTAT